MSLAPTSPRLPSPPPPTEIQTGPPSPSSGSSFAFQHDNVIEQKILDASAIRRIHPGTKSADMAAGPPLVPLAELDSAFQLQEHLKALHYHYTRQSDSSTPVTRTTAALIAQTPEGIDRNLWVYELCRFLINKCNDLIIGFFSDNPPCTIVTCPEMRASEWQFLCAVHETPKSCCAIDYCCHTLDWAAGIVTSQKHFPSRLSLSGGAASDDSVTNVQQLVNIFRRLQRIFAHAWFQHLDVFWEIEGQTGLYVLFKTVCDMYDLLPQEAYKLPPPAEGLEAVEETSEVPTILKADTDPVSHVAAENREDPAFMSVGRTNTRRHIRSSPSTGFAVTTVLEAEEDETDMSSKLGAMKLSQVDSTAPTSGESFATTELPIAPDAGSVIELSTTETVTDVEPDSGRESTSGGGPFGSADAKAAGSPKEEVKELQVKSGSLQREDTDPPLANEADDVKVENIELEV